MKRTLIISLLVAAMGMIAFVSCEKEDTTGNPTNTIVASQTTETPASNPQGETTPVTHNTTLSYTQCKSHGQKDIPEETISANYENGNLQIMVENMCISCGVFTVIAESEIDEQTIIVDFGLIYESQANCICLIDADYSIDNIKPGNYELIIREGSLVIYQEEITCE